MAWNRGIIPLFISHQGCPNDCAFCNQRRISSRQAAVKKEEILAEIDRYLTYFAHKDRVDVAFYGGSFTGLGYEQMTFYLELVQAYRDRGLIDRVRLSTRPDYIDGEILEFLKAWGVATIELGAQSTDEEVLRINHRNHDLSAIQQASGLIRGAGLELGLQMMCFLPGSSPEKDQQTARDFVDLQADFVRIYPTLVIKNTLLEDWYQQGIYKPLSLDQAVDEVLEIYKIFHQAQLPVIRLGLQASEDLEKNSLVAGPYHPAFRSLVEARWMRQRLEPVLGEFFGAQEVIVHSSGADQPNLVGLGAANKTYFQERYQIKKLGFRLHGAGGIRIQQGDTIRWLGDENEVKRN